MSPTMNFLFSPPRADFSKRSPKKALAPRKALISVALLFGLVASACAQTNSNHRADPLQEQAQIHSAPKAVPEAPTSDSSTVNTEAHRDLLPTPPKKTPSLREACAALETSSYADLQQAWAEAFQRVDPVSQDLLPCLEKMCPTSDADPICLHAKAKILISTEHFEAASQVALSALAAHPEDSTAFALLSLSSLGLGKLGEAFLLARRSVQLDTSSFEGNYALALALASDETLENDAEAVALLKHTLDEAPEFLSAWKALGQLALRHRDYGLAENAFRQVASLEGNSGWCDLRLAWSVEAQKNPDGTPRVNEAILLYEQAVNHPQTRLDAILGLAALKADILKSPESAVDLFQQALALMDATDPRRPQVEASLKKAEEKIVADQALQRAAQTSDGAL